VESRTLQQVVEAADTLYGDLTETQQQALKTLYAGFRDTMNNWNIPSIKNGFQ
jgi:hypothetical protein